MTIKLATILVFTYILVAFIPAARMSAQCGTMCTGWTAGDWVNASWVGYRYSAGTYIQDGSDENPTSTDLIFDATNAPPSVLVASDGTNAYFRMQVEGDPSGQRGFAQYMWIVEVYNAANVHMCSVGINGMPSGGANDYVFVNSPDGAQHVNVYAPHPTGMRYGAVAGTTHYYVDFQVPICVLTYVTCTYGASLNPQQPAITDNTPIKLSYGTSTSSQSINKDFAACAGSNCTVDFATLSTATFSNIQNGSLPVQLTTFSARRSREGTELAWTTVSESNCLGFDIERSGDRREWNRIGFVSGRGSSNTPGSYEFTDVDSREAAGPFYYRLKEIDRDGRATISTIVEVRDEFSAPLSPVAVSPNPYMRGTGPIDIRFQLENPAPVYISVYTQAGELVSRIERGQLGAGAHIVQWFGAEATAAGSYLVVLTSRDIILGSQMIHIAR